MDKLPQESTLFYIISILALIGSIDIIDEILNHACNITSTNTVKKILLWTVIYTKTQSVFHSTLFSIIIILLFPKIFFGKLSGRITKINKA